MADQASKSVVCHDWAPKSGGAQHTVSRAFCVMQPTPSCPTCVHRNFTITFQVGIGAQEVACPRWTSLSGRGRGERPTYETMRRETCLQLKPFDYCPSCPNSNATNLPEDEPGWFEKMYGGKK